MTALVLRLAGPLQSWGSASRFAKRMTEAAPTKSGILGLLAAAKGLRRSDPIEDLLSLELAVRTEQPGELLRDFHTAHHRITGKAMPLTERFYWADAVFTAHIGGPSPVLEGLDEALRDPAYPLYLGRRSCVPEGRVSLGLFERSVADSVRELAWAPGFTGRRANRNRSTVRLAVQADSSVFTHEDALSYTRELNDLPVSFNPENRQYRIRPVIDTFVVVPTGNDVAGSAGLHDPMAILGGLQ